MIDAVLLVVITMAPILGLWFLVSRHPVMRWVIAESLATVLAAGCAVLALDPRGWWLDLTEVCALVGRGPDPDTVSISLSGQA